MLVESDFQACSSSGSLVYLKIPCLQLRGDEFVKPYLLVITYMYKKMLMQSQALSLPCKWHGGYLQPHQTCSLRLSEIFARAGHDGAALALAGSH